MVAALDELAAYVNRHTRHFIESEDYFPFNITYSTFEKEPSEYTAKAIEIVVFIEPHISRTLERLIEYTGYNSGKGAI